MLLSYFKVLQKKLDQPITAPATIPRGDLCQEPRDQWRVRDDFSTKEGMADLDPYLHQDDSTCRTEEQRDCSTSLLAPKVPNAMLLKNLF